VRVRQIAWNLLSNAIKFTPSGGKVKVALTREGDEARLDVIDTGQGIDPQTLPHIFELFRQSEQLSRPHGGMGIGLALVHQLVELHGGRIEVHSDGVGKGSRFSVWLPLYTVPPPDLRTLPVVRPTVAQDSRTDTGPRATLTGLRVLVIDDGEDAVTAMRELLQMEGAVVDGAMNGEEAIELVGKHRYDAIISDIAMPGMDGFTLLRTIHAGGPNQHTPAIACTGFNRPQDLERATREGFAAYLSKPVGMRDLVDAIQRVTQRGGGLRTRLLSVPGPASGESPARRSED